MRVDIGPYRGDLIPIYRLEQKYEKLRAKQLGIHDWDFDETHYRWYDRVADVIFCKLYSLTAPLNRWSNKRPRNIDIQIDSYDTWSVEHTLALIIVPLLKKYKEVNHGSPMVDLSDVPEHLQPTEEANENNGYIDNTHHLRWQWVIDEMIWAFEQHVIGSDVWEDQFIHNYEQLDIKWVEIEDEEYKGCSRMTVNYQKDPSKPPYFRDEAAIWQHRSRMENGRRLFAKYYQNLWD